MKLSISGETYKSTFTDVNSQRCINMFPMTAGPGGRGSTGDTPMVLTPTSGLKLLTAIPGNQTRALKTVGDYTYAVVDSTAYQCTVNAASETISYTSIGTLSSSTGTVYIASNLTQIMFVDGTADGYIYTPAAGTFQNILSVDTDFPGATHVAYIDGYFIVNAPGTQLFYTSALNDGLTWDPLDVASAESSTDKTIALGVVKGELWILGTNSTEVWYDAANASGSPFSARTGLGLRIGCGAANSVVEINDLLIWLDNRGFVVQSDLAPFLRNNNTGYQLAIVSNEAVTSEILSYGQWSDAIATTYNDRGHIMYQITFPTAEKTWVYDYTTKMWHERAYRAPSLGQDREHLCQYCTQVGTGYLVAGVRSGNMYLMSSAYYDDAGTPIRRTRVTTPQNNEFSLLGIDMLQVRVGSVDVPVTGLGSDPKMGLRYSVDGGHTWSNEMLRSIGQTGQYARPISWNRLGSGREWIFEFNISEPIGFALIDASLSISEVE